MTDLSNMHLWDRLNIAKQHLEPVQSQYRILWEDPDEPDAPAKVTCPDPNWMACALHGGILPPIDAYLADKKVTDAYEREHGSQKGFNWRKAGGAKHPYAKPVGPMTEEEAIEYLILKDLPTRVVEYEGNRTILKIVPVQSIPTDRKYRNAWVIKQEEEAA